MSEKSPGQFRLILLAGLMLFAGVMTIAFPAIRYHYNANRMEYWRDRAFYHSTSREEQSLAIDNYIHYREKLTQAGVLKKMEFSFDESFNGNERLALMNACRQNWPQLGEVEVGYSESIVTVWDSPARYDFWKKHIEVSVQEIILRR